MDFLNELLNITKFRKDSGKILRFLDSDQIPDIQKILGDFKESDKIAKIPESLQRFQKDSEDEMTQDYKIDFTVPFSHLRPGE